MGLDLGSGPVDEPDSGRLLEPKSEQDLVPELGPGPVLEPEPELEPAPERVLELVLGSERERELALEPEPEREPEVSILSRLRSKWFLLRDARTE